MINQITSSESLPAFNHCIIQSSTASSLLRNSSNDAPAPSLLTNGGSDIANDIFLMNETLNLHPNDGSTSVSSLSSVTSSRFRHVPFTMTPFEVQHIRWNAEKFVGTQYANLLSPTLVNYDDQEERVAQLEESIKQNRKFIKTTAQKNIKQK